jgi:hypothetical protein
VLAGQGPAFGPQVTVDFRNGLGVLVLGEFQVWWEEFFIKFANSYILHKKSPFY